MKDTDAFGVSYVIWHNFAHWNIYQILAYKWVV